MRMSEAGIAFLVSHEGVVPAPYRDSVGVWTYGIGHTAAAGAPDPSKMGRGMPRDLEADLGRAFSVFCDDLARYEAEVSAVLSGIPYSQVQFDAAVSFHYNTGAIRSASWVKRWIAGDMVGAKKAIMNWRKPASIIPRREAERDLWANGVYGSKEAAVWQVSERGQVIWKPIKSLSQRQIIAYLRPHEAPRPDPKPTAKPEPKWPLAALLGRK